MLAVFNPIAAVDAVNAHFFWSALRVHSAFFAAYTLPVLVAAEACGTTDTTAKLASMAATKVGIIFFIAVFSSV